VCRLSRARDKRHTFAVHFLQGGSAVTDLQGLLGHASLATTQVYAKMVDSRTRASVLALDYGIPEAPAEKKPDGVRTTCVPVGGEEVK